MIPVRDDPGSGNDGGTDPGGGKDSGNDPGGKDPGGGKDPSGGTDPGGGGNDFGGRLARAALRWSFSPNKLAQYEPTRFTATITYDRQVSGRIILVAYENVATLRETKKGELDCIVRRTGASQRLDEGHSAPGGGYELSWEWDVIPEDGGQNTRTRDTARHCDRRFQEGGIQVRNEPVPISVRVHPERGRFLGRFPARRANCLSPSRLNWSPDKPRRYPPLLLLHCSLMTRSWSLKSP